MTDATTTHLIRSLRRGEGERGSSSVEAIIILPVLFGIFFIIIQGAVWLQAGNIAQSAATSAYNAARLFDGTTSDGAAAGYATADQAGSILSNTVVTIDRTATTVTVTVSGDAPTLIPGMTTHVERTVSGPVERWVA